MRILRYFWLYILAVFLSPVYGGFIRGHSLTNLNCSAVALDPLVIFVAIDVNKSLMKFLINTKVNTQENVSSINPVITDVDSLTNRYTTLNVEIEFRGKTFILENLRFCDILTVKNTSMFEDTYRFNKLIPELTLSSVSTATTVPNPKAPHHFNGANGTSGTNLDVSENISLQKRGGFFETTLMSTSPANSNSSIEGLFNNKTSEFFGCPLYQNDSIVFYYQADVSDNLYKLGSYTAKFTIVSNNEDSDIIGGAVGYITSAVRSKELQRSLYYGILALGIFFCVLHFLIIVSSPNQESHNPFLIEASAICNERLLKQLEANPLTLFSYLQFAVFMGGLNVQYPGFFQYTMGKISWCALLNINVFHKWVTIPSSDLDNVFLTYYSGLKSLASYTSTSFNSYSWPNFITCLLIWIAVGMFGYQIFITLKVLAQNPRAPKFLQKVFIHKTEINPTESDGRKKTTGFTYSWSTNVWALIGQFLQQFLTIFGLPFLVLTIYMLFTASHMKSFNGEPNGLTQANAFNDTIPYQVLNPQATGVTDHVVNSLNLWHAPHETRSGIPVLSVIFGALSLFMWIAFAFYFLYYYISPILVKGREKQNVNKLFTSVRAIVTWAYLYNAYKPSKVYYVAVDLFECILSLIFIATLQYHPSVQVALMIVLQFVSSVLLIVFRPYFLPMSWHSLPFLQLMARLFVTILNIPYLRQFNFLETTRTNVAYCQMLIHIIVVSAYALHLIYCLVITVMAIVKLRRKTAVEAKTTHEPTNGIDILGNFEFRQVPIHPSEDHTDVQSSMRSSLDGEVDYYRSKSERILREMEHHDSRLDGKEDSIGDADNTSLDYQQTERRIRQTDYTTREADRIFQKYFSAHEMDPEMRALWESRDWNNNLRPLLAKVEVSKCETSFFEKIWKRFRPTKKKGFEVVRRRPIVVAPGPVALKEEGERVLE